MSFDVTSLGRGFSLPSEPLELEQQHAPHKASLHPTSLLGAQSGGCAGTRWYLSWPRSQAVFSAKAPPHYPANRARFQLQFLHCELRPVLTGASSRVLVHAPYYFQADIVDEPPVLNERQNTSASTRHSRHRLLLLIVSPHPHESAIRAEHPTQPSLTDFLPSASTGAYGAAARWLR